MNRQWLIGFSLALNVALGTGVFLMTRPASPGPAPRAAAPAVSGDGVLPASGPVTSVAPALPFQWGQIADANLKVYRDNLRAIGCPEATVRDILRAVINAQFAPRRVALLDSFEGRFWRLLTAGELSRRQAVTQTDWGKSLVTLNEERQKLILDVLGMETHNAGGESAARDERLLARRSWLPAAKRDRLIELEGDYDRKLSEWTRTVASRPDKVPTAADEARLRAMQQDFAEAKKQLLSPGELEELRLRDSDAADWAAGLSGFQPTEEEWRAITRLRLDNEASEQSLAASDPGADAQAAGAKDLEDQLDHATEQVLGADRYAQYQLANNGEYQGVRDVTRRFGLPDNIAAQTYQVQKDAQAAAEKVRSDPELSPDQCRSALAAIQSETRSALVQTLGENVFPTYQQYHGDWLNDLDSGGNR